MFTKLKALLSAVSLKLKTVRVKAWTIIKKIWAGVTFPFKELLKGLAWIAIFIYAVIMTIIDYILAIHSDDKTASHKRWLCSFIVIAGVILFIWLRKSGPLTTADATVLCVMFGAFGVAYGAGAFSGTGTSPSSFFNIKENIKKYFKL